MCPAMPDEQTVQLLFAQGVNSNTVYDRDMQMTKIPFLFCMFCAMLNTLVAISDHMLCHLSPEQKTFQAYLFLCKNHRNCPADLRRRCADLLNSSRRLERKITMKLGIVINQPFFINPCTSIKVRKTAWLQGFLKKQKHKAPCKIT